MKIVYIVKYIAQLGGLDRIISFKMNYLAEKLGYEVYLLTYEQGNHPLSFSLSPKIQHIDINVRFFTLHKYCLLKRVLFYINMRHNFRTRVKYNIDLIDPDIVVTSTYSYLIIDIIMGLPSKYKKIVESHVDKNSTIKQKDYKSYSLLNYFAKQYDNYILHSLKKCDAFVTLTKGDYWQWKGIPRKVIIPNAISINSSQCSSLQNKRVISVGRLEPQKGFDMLISAWKIVSQRHPDWVLDIYGDGGLYDTLHGEIIGMNLSDSCTMHKATSHIGEKYLESSIYAMSSIYEGFGLVLIEAMSFGVPCVSFDCPYGPSEIISNNIDGILVEQKNIDKLADGICSLIEDREKRMEYGKRAKISVERYSPENIMPKWDELFRSLLK